MINIPMCSNDECPLSNTCFRFRAEPSVHQEVEFFMPGVDGICEEHIAYADERPTKKSRSRKNTQYER